jgi:hypothetical protein
MSTSTLTAIILCAIELAIILYGIHRYAIDWGEISWWLAVMAIVSVACALVVRLVIAWPFGWEGVIGGFAINLLITSALAAALFIVDIASRCGWSPRVEMWLDKFTRLLSPIYRFTSRR